MKSVYMAVITLLALPGYLQAATRVMPEYKKINGKESIPGEVKTGL